VRDLAEPACPAGHGACQGGSGLSRRPARQGGQLKADTRKPIVALAGHPSDAQARPAAEAWIACILRGGCGEARVRGERGSAECIAEASGQHGALQGPLRLSRIG